MQSQSRPRRRRSCQLTCTYATASAISITPAPRRDADSPAKKTVGPVGPAVRHADLWPICDRTWIAQGSHDRSSALRSRYLADRLWPLLAARCCAAAAAAALPPLPPPLLSARAAWTCTCIPNGRRVAILPITTSPDPRPVPSDPCPDVRTTQSWAQSLPVSRHAHALMPRPHGHSRAAF